MFKTYSTIGVMPTKPDGNHPINVIDISKRRSQLLKKQLVSAWNDPIAYCAHYESIIFSLCQDVDSSYSNKVCILLHHNEIDQLLSLDINPNDYSNHKDYIKDNLIYTTIKKYPHWDTSHNPLEQAIKTFIDCEIKCDKHNRRIKASRTEFDTSVVPQTIMNAKRKIAKILGNVPSISSLPIDFGPGASFTVKGRTTDYDKLTGALDVTPEATSAAIELLQSCPGWLSLHGVSPSDTSRIRDVLTIIPGSRLSFVPKTAKTHRPINIEPGLNKIIQKGYGSVIRNRLKHSGLTLNRCPERHRRLAQRASVDNSLATVDLSSASDLINWESVFELLPFTWFSALDTVRSTRYRYENKWYEFHKFSAMGNGYTFELESLIFYSLAFAVTKELGLKTEDVSVFGDDIIIPQEACPVLYDVLAYFGFEVNEQKSFSFGPFRESCGGDFYQGIDVRGFYIKDWLDLRTIVRYRNYLYRTGYKYYFKRCFRFLNRLLSKFNTYLAGPDDGTDDHIIFDHLSFNGKPFNFVHMSLTGRKTPRRWHARRVWYLYRAMDIAPINYFNVTDRSDTERLADRRTKIIVSLSSRTDRKSVV